MISWLISLFHIHPDPNDMTAARYKVCRLLSCVGIFLNFVLFASKYAIGYLVGSVAIKGDAVNNLTDFMSNFISILSFRLAESRRTGSIRSGTNAQKRLQLCSWG